MNESVRKAKKVTKAGSLVSSGGRLARYLLSIGPEKFLETFQNKIVKGSAEITFPNGRKKTIRGREKARTPKSSLSAGAPCRG